MIEAEVRVDFDQPYVADSWSRVAIATWIQKEALDPNNFDPTPFNVKGNSYTQLFTEFDVYRRNFPLPGYNAFASGGNVNEYPADQIPIGGNRTR